MAVDLTILREPCPLTANGSRTLQTTAVGTESSTRAAQTILVVGLSAVLIFAVLAFGSFDEWAIAILEISCALLLLLWIWPRISSGGLQLRANPLFAPVVVFGLII